MCLSMRACTQKPVADAVSAGGQKQMTHCPIKTKENYGINHCQRERLQPLGFSEVKYAL